MSGPRQAALGAAPGKRAFRVLDPHIAEVHVSLFESMFDTTPKPWTGPLGELLGDCHRIASEKDGPGWSPLVYHPGAARGNEGVEHATALVFDLDELKADQWTTLLDRLKAAKVAGAAHTTWSNGPEKGDCWRVVLLVSRPILPDEFEAARARTNLTLLEGLADPGAKDLARLSYLPSCPPDRVEHARIIYLDGRALDVDKVLRSRAPKVEKKPDGSNGHAKIRHPGRHAYLLKVAGAMRAQGCDEASILAALRLENSARCEPPKTDEEVAFLAQDVAGRYSPNESSEVPLTDSGNAVRLVALHGQDFRHCRDLGRDFLWDRNLWVPDRTGAAMRFAESTAASFYVEAAKTTDKDLRKRLAHWGAASESRTRLEAMLALARTRPEVAIRSSDLDQKPMLLAVKNGTLDLETGKLCESRREDLISLQAGTHFDSKATCPLWRGFLKRVVPDSSVRAYLQRAVGYSLTANVSEEVLQFLCGPGANGKSVFVATVQAMLGDLGRTAAPNLLIAKHHEPHPTEVADLLGARFVATIEVEEGKRFAEMLVKKLASHDRVKARFMREDFFEFAPTWKIWLAANHKPVVRADDYAIWRRIALVPFEVTIPPEERDKKLPEKLRAELPGILRWAVQGCLDWQRDGLNPPATVQRATETYREESDPVGRFIDSGLIEEVSGEVEPSSVVYETYRTWARGNGEREISGKRFSLGLKSRGFLIEKSSRTRGMVVLGLRLAPG